MPHAGPWVRCHICGFDKIATLRERRWKEDIEVLAAWAEMLRDVREDLKESNDRGGAE